jgi:hypothetical protein
MAHRASSESSRLAAAFRIGQLNLAVGREVVP